MFETNIPFQLAFYALIEHGALICMQCMHVCPHHFCMYFVDAVIAPLWDPERRTFVAMMGLTDYINVLKLYHRQGVPQADLANKTINDMLAPPVRVFKHGDLQTVDAEDTVFQLCGLLHRLGTDYVPVVDPDVGNIVAILGYLDLVHLLHEASRQHPQFFTSTVDQMQIGTLDKVVTAPQSMRLYEAIDLMEASNISGIPVIDEAGKVVGLYHRSDVSFITQAVDPDVAIQGLHALQVGEALRLQQTTISESNAMQSNQVLCICSRKDSLASVIDVMMRSQVTLLPHSYHS